MRTDSARDVAHEADSFGYKGRMDLPEPRLLDIPVPSALTHKIALDPTVRQRRAFSSFAGCHRVVYNFLLGCWWDWWRTYERSGRTTTKPNFPELKRTFNSLRCELFPWMNDPLAAHRDCWSQPFVDLQAAFSGWLRGRNDRPTFKSKRDRQEFYVANDKTRFDDHAIHLPKVGRTKMREALRFEGKILSTRVVRESDGRWYACVSVEGDHRRAHVGQAVLGLDLGVHHAVAVSDGRTFDSPKPLAHAIKRLRRAQRALSRRQKGSHRRTRAVARVGAIHARVKNIRTDWTHKVTTTLIRESQAVGIEDLHVKNMQSMRTLARALSDVGMAELRRQIQYKAALSGTAVVLADPWYPSTQLCSRCGGRQKMSLLTRKYHCTTCGLVLDRDVNAALNLRFLVPRASGKPLPDGPAATCVETGSSWSLKRETNLDPVAMNHGFESR